MLPLSQLSEFDSNTATALMDSVITFVRLIKTITEQLIRVIYHEPDTAHAACSQQRQHNLLLLYNFALTANY